jgi:uncharacterized protein (TIGR02646 family)
MRPIRRGSSSLDRDFSNYRDAKQNLIERIGSYCSYCEIHLSAQLAVEHIQPKNLPQYKILEGRWQNFLLACARCNSTKGVKDVALADHLLPDRDNTSIAYRYLADGSIEISSDLERDIQEKALATLSLLCLDRGRSVTTNPNKKAKEPDLLKQRRETWLQAENAKEIRTREPGDSRISKLIVDLALATGHFSVWMQVFSDDPDMRHRLIEAFPGTKESGCFDPQTAQPVQPAPNPDQLPYGGKA